MGAPDLLGLLQGMGLNVVACGADLHVSPRTAITEEARRLIREHKQELLAALTSCSPKPFTFSLPGDLVAEREALEERAAIIAEGCGMDQATAFQEARWDLHRQRTWSVFLRNAEHILHAPRSHWAALLGLYRTEAARQYGEGAAADMAGTMRLWVESRGVH